MFAVQHSPRNQAAETPEVDRAIEAIREMQIKVRASNRRRRSAQASARRRERKAQLAIERKAQQEQRKAQRAAKPKMTRYVRKPDMPGRQKPAGRKNWFADPDKTLCTKCKTEPRATGQRWCAKCHAAYMRGYNRVQDGPR